MLNTLAIVLPCLVVALGCFLGYQILLQNGRLLLRIEALEERFKQREDEPRGNEPTVHQAPPEGLSVGTPAPDFRLPDLEGKLTSLSAYRGRRVLLIFFNIGCGFCVRMAPALKALTSRRGDTDPITLLVAAGDPVENATFFRKNGIECAVLLQREMEVASVFKAQGTPMGYLIDEQGRIASDLAAGEAALLALVGFRGVESGGSPAAANGRDNGNGYGNGHGNPNGHHHAIPQGSRPLEESQLNRSGLKAGTLAPPFTLPRIDRGEDTETLSLESFRGRQVLLVFSDPGCGPCGELVVKLERFWRERPSTQILMISRGEPGANRDKIAEQQLTFPVVLQRKWEISKLYGMFATPIAYLIDEEGVIVSDVAVGVEPILGLLAGVESGGVRMAAV